MSDGIIKRLTVYIASIRRKESSPPSTDIIMKEKARFETKLAVPVVINTTICLFVICWWVSVLHFCVLLVQQEN